MVNVDKMYENKVGDLVQARLPILPDRGSKPGSERSWREIVHWVFLNRRKTSSQKLYHKHSLHEDHVSEKCKLLIEKGLIVHTHADRDSRFAVQGRTNSAPQLSIPVVENNSLRRRVQSTPNVQADDDDERLCDSMQVLICGQQSCSLRCVALHAC